MTGNCPSGYQICNPDAKADFRICSIDTKDCPINDIKFTSTNENDPKYQY